MKERALFKTKDACVRNCAFDVGESPLKESSDIDVQDCIFHYRYPLWYCKNVKVKNTSVLEAGRAGIWYTDNITIEDSIIEAPKCIRRCDGVTLTNVSFPAGPETLWKCRNVKMKNVTVRGDYFAMDSENITVDGLSLTGKYSFDGVKNVTMDRSSLVTKDAFWNSENVTVKNSTVIGEYIGWNSKNLTFENCTIESLQGLCYIENLRLINCKLINTTLALEYSSVDADITSHVDSIFNPTSGVIRAKSIGELTLDPDCIDPSATEVHTEE